MQTPSDSRPEFQTTKDDEMKDLTKYVTTREAAELLGVDSSRVRGLLLSDRIKGKKLGHDWLVFRPSLEKYFAHKSTRGRPPSKRPKIKIKSRETNNGQGE